VLILGALLIAAVTAGLAMAERRDREPAATTGNVRPCAELKRAAARACYRREVGAQLAAVGGAPRAVFSAPADNAVTFAAEDAQGLLCDLHTRVGVTDTARASWVSWSEPPVS
jgi:hypothetical protein